MDNRRSFSTSSKASWELACVLGNAMVKGMDSEPDKIDSWDWKRWSLWDTVCMGTTRADNYSCGILSFDIIESAYLSTTRAFCDGEVTNCILAAGLMYFFFDVFSLNRLLSFCFLVINFCKST